MVDVLYFRSLVRWRMVQQIDLLETLRQIEQERAIPLPTLIRALEDALSHAYKKRYGVPGNLKVRLDSKASRVRITVQKRVVERVENPHTQISVEDARKVRPDAKVGDWVEVEVSPEELGRIAAQTARQVVFQKLREAERDVIYERFCGKEGEVVTGRIRRIDGRDVYLDLGQHAEGWLPPSEQVPGEEYSRRSPPIKVYIVDVRKTPQGALIRVSRNRKELVTRLLELHVPEIQEGIVEIRGVARKPGVRSKVAVASRDRNVDPKGACIGNRGLRIREITQELSKLITGRQQGQSRGERIDVVRWSPDIKEFIAEALQPAKVEEVIVEEDSEDRCVVRVIVPDDQLSQAIGKDGVNVWLAAKLVESVRTRGARGGGFQCKIDIKPVSEWLKEQMGMAEAGEGIAASSETVEAASSEVVEGEPTAAPGASAGEANVTAGDKSPASGEGG